MILTFCVRICFLRFFFFSNIFTLPTAHFTSSTNTIFLSSLFLLFSVSWPAKLFLAALPFPSADLVLYLKWALFVCMSNRFLICILLKQNFYNIWDVSSYSFSCFYNCLDPCTPFHSVFIYIPFHICSVQICHSNIFNLPFSFSFFQIVQSFYWVKSKDREVKYRHLFSLKIQD